MPTWLVTTKGRSVSITADRVTRPKGRVLGWQDTPEGPVLVAILRRKKSTTITRSKP